MLVRLLGTDWFRNYLCRKKNMRTLPTHMHARTHTLPTSMGPPDPLLPGKPFPVIHPQLCPWCSDIQYVISNVLILLSSLFLILLSCPLQVGRSHCVKAVYVHVRACVPVCHVTQECICIRLLAITDTLTHRFLRGNAAERKRSNHQIKTSKFGTVTRFPELWGPSLFFYRRSPAM